MKLARRELGLAAIFGAFAAGEVMACTVNSPSGVEDIVSSFFEAVCSAEIDEAADMLSDNFKFYRDLDKTHVGKADYVEMIRQFPKIDKKESSAQDVVVGDNEHLGSQIIRREFIRYMDTPERMSGTCGYAFNRDVRLAVYDVNGGPSLVVPPQPRPTHDSTEQIRRPLNKFHGAKTAALRYISIPVTLNG